MTSEQRQALAHQMVEYYRSTPTYFDGVQAAAESRPSDEELVLFRAIARLFGGSKGGARVLELGCGRCESAPKLIEMLGGGDYRGVDASPDALDYARGRHPEFHLTTGDISHLALDSDSFDVVMMNYVLEHTCEPDRVLDEALRVLRVGGLLALIVPVGDLPWMLPQSLRHRRRDPLFFVRYTLGRWRHFLRLRYVQDYFAFPVVLDPVVLARPDLTFVPDDDQIYDGSTIEILKYLRRTCDIPFSVGRDIGTYIRNGRRPIVDLARATAFLGLRICLARPREDAFTTTLTLVARKRGH